MTARCSLAPLRRRLLTGSAPTLALLLGAVPALASPLDVSGSPAIASDQVLIDAPVRAGAPDSSLAVTMPSAAGTIVLADTVIAARAGGNSTSASLPLAAGAGLLQSGPATTVITSGPDGTSLTAGVALASRQAALASPVSARLLAPAITIAGPAASGLSAALRGSQTLAAAHGNEIEASVRLEGSTILRSAGLVSQQTVDAGSPVAAQSDGLIALQAGPVAASELTLAGNTVNAEALGNNAGSALAVDGAAIVLGQPAGPAASLDARDGRAALRAAYAVLSNQSAAATVSALAEPDLAIASQGNLVTSSVSLTDNRLAARAFGNRAVGSLDLAASGIARAATGGAGGALASLAAEQRLAGQAIMAQSLGAPHLAVAGTASDAALTLSGNRSQADALGNLVEADSLTVAAGSLALAPTPAPGPDSGSGGPGIIIGTALLDPAGQLSATAPISLLDLQDAGSAAIAAAQDGAVTVSLAGGGQRLRIALTGNGASSSAGANQASERLVVSGASLRTAVDLATLQQASGLVSAVTGSAAVPAGARVSSGAPLQDTAVAIADGSASASAAGNRIDNGLTIAGSSLSNGGGHLDAEAGALAGGRGAAAEYALASAQRFGPPASGESAAPARISARVTADYGFAAGATLTRGSLALSGNAAGAEALGNAATNRLAVTAGTASGQLPMPYPPGLALLGAPGAALSSSQQARGEAEAVSDLVLTLPASASDSALGLAGNASSARSRLNQADNRLEFTAGSVLRPIALDAGVAAAPGGLRASAGLVLANSQQASGRSEARATNELGPVGASLSAPRSSLSVSGNTVRADAAANQALNALALNLSGGSSSAALANDQDSTAAVAAVARADLAAVTGLGGSLNLADNAVAAEARGNDAANRIDWTAGGSSQPAGSAQLHSGGGADRASGGAVLRSDQNNGGAIFALASATLDGGVLNAPDRLTLAGNASAATALGNSAVNTMTFAVTDRMPSAALLNSQVNCAPVTALVSASTRLGGIGPVNVSGTVLAATAIGNYAMNTVAVNR